MPQLDCQPVLLFRICVDPGMKGFLDPHLASFLSAVKIQVHHLTFDLI
jgi:hypothetical protein